MSAYGPFADCPGLGDDEYPGFPADVCPEEMPDFSKHHSLLADVFKKDPGQYEKYRLLRTRLGVGLAKCIKTGADNRGHPMIKTVGLVAGDEYCYETFSDIFDRIVRHRHGDDCFSRPHFTDMDRNKVSSLRADGSGKYVLSTQIRAARGLAGVRFPPALTFQDRREVERVIVRALLEMDGALKGDYFPLPASQSYAPKPGGMNPEEEEELRKANLVFEQPDSTTTLCSGIGRHWPDARGVFVNGTRSFSVWVNEEEHLRAIAVRQGDEIQEAFLEMTEALDNITLSLQRHADCPDGFSHSAKLGFLTSCPSNVGTAMRISVILKLPLLTEQAGLAAWCAKRRLTLRSAIDESGAQLCGVMEVSNCDRLGLTEVEAVNLVIEAVTELVLAEQRLEAGGPGIEAAAEPGATTSTAPAKPEKEAETPKAPLAMSPTPSEQDNVNWDVAGNALGMLFSCTVDEKPAKLDAPEALVSPKKSPEEVDREAAAAKIQSIQKGRAERKMVEKKKKEESAAAAKIQAIQRGRHERQEVQKHKEKCDAAATKIQAIQRGKEARKAKGAKETAAPSSATVEDVKAKAKATLEAALENGNLGTVLQEIKGDGPKASAEDVRLQMKQLLETSCDSGALQKALEEVKNEKQQARDSEAVRQQMKEILVSAEASGKLEDALRNVQGDKKAAETEDIRVHVKNLLEEAANSGALASALMEVKGASSPPKAPSPSVEEVRTKMREMLEESCDSGALMAALREVKAPSPSVEDVRKKMREMLEESCDSGALSQALREVKAGGEPDIESVRQKMRGMLEEACDTGSLAEALANLKDGKDGDALEDIRLQMKEMLEAACDSGALHDALQAGKQEKSSREVAVRDPCRDLLAEFTHADETTLGTAGAMPLLLAVSNCDRRIGALNAMITETQRRIRDQDAYATQLEADIAAAKQDSSQLASEYDRQQRILDEADATHRKLQDKQKKLFDDLDDEALKHRHCILDLDPSMYSARSEMSTVCTVRDLQNTDLHSPFNQVNPAALTAPPMHLS